MPYVEHVPLALLPASTAAEMANCSIWTVSRAARHGALPGHQIGGVWMFDRSAVEQWIVDRDAKRTNGSAA